MAFGRLRSLTKWIATRGEVPRYQDAYASLEWLFTSRVDPWGFEADAYNDRRFDRIVDLIERVPHRSVLDVGCAEGHLTRRLCAVAERVVGVDASPTAASRARRAAPAAEIHHATLEDVAFDEMFDVVVCSEMIYYPRDPVGAVSKLNGLGQFIVLTYTSYESDRLDRMFGPIPTLHRGSCRYLRLFDSGRIINWHESRLLLWWSGVMTKELVDAMRTASTAGCDR
jgi:SAM-dependent methyltransferase